MILFLLISQLFAQSPQTVYKNNTAHDLFNEDKVFESKQILQNEVIENPGSPELKYNFGKVFEKSNEVDDAIREYVAAAKSNQNSELQFQSLFNAARLYGDKKDIPNALKYYQLALDIKPDSLEVKTNIELLIQNGGGGGGGENNQQQNQNQDQNENKEGDGKQNQQQPPPPQGKPEQKKQQPQKFKSQELSEQDVRRILEELKRQEDQIRKKMNEQKTQESPIGKDW
jgi:tetratricopeptide (TPR) repeat protein